MDLLEHAVRNIEEFMAAPFPNGYVGLLFGDAVSGDSAGTYFGTHIAILADYDIDDDSYYADYAGHIIAHEVRTTTGMTTTIGSMKEPPILRLPSRRTPGPASL